MPRDARPPGTWGKIGFTEVAPDKWRARARYRDYSGKTRLVERHGPTKTAAENQLLQVLSEMDPTPDGAAEITRNTKIGALADYWLKELEESEHPYAESTLALYRDTVRAHIKPGVGALSIHEATPAKLNKFFRALDAASVRKRAKVCVKGMFGTAIVHGAVTSNPVTALADRTRKARGHARPKAAVRVLTFEELTELRERMHEWAQGNRFGPPRGADLPDLFDVLAGTGLRIGEVLALRWSDVDLVGEPPLLTVTGTVVSGHRQEHPKTSTSWRTIALPKFAVSALRRQQERGLPTDQDLVFPSQTGAARATHNVRRQLREARGEDFEWVTPHVYRRTAATIIERAVDLDAAAAQLGHSGTAVTRAHYIARAASAPDLRHALAVLGPDERDG